MSLFNVAADLIGGVGFNAIKHSGRIALGGGKAVIGVVTSDPDLIEEGLGSVVKGSIGLGTTLITRGVLSNEDTDGECNSELFDYDG